MKIRQLMIALMLLSPFAGAALAQSFPPVQLSPVQLDFLVTILRNDKDACNRQLEAFRMFAAEQASLNAQHDKEVDAYWRRYTGLDAAVTQD